MNYARIVSASSIVCALGFAHLVGCSSDTASSSSSSTSGGSSSGGGSQDAAATCASPKTVCGGNCVDTAKDSDNCGACGTACSASEICSAGKCSTTCGGDSTKCSVGGKDACVNVQTDNENCGACGTKCAAGSVCSAGKCGLTCSTGYTACTSLPVVTTDGGTDGGDAAVSDAAVSDAAVSDAAVVDAGAFQPYCADFKKDSLNCGTCGSKCAAGKTCSNGGCCDAGQTFCSSTCIDTANDEQNCGGCGTVCSGGTPVCLGGTCKACPAGFTLEAGQCTKRYDIKAGDIISQVDSGSGLVCTGYQFHTHVEGFAGFQWVDTLPGGTAVSSVTVEVAMSYVEQNISQGTAFNNGTIYDLTRLVVNPAPGGDSCPAGAVSIAANRIVKVNLDPTRYLPGATNAFRERFNYNPGNHYEVWGLNSDWGSSYARVTVKL